MHRLTTLSAILLCCAIPAMAQAQQPPAPSQPAPQAEATLQLPAMHLHDPFIVADQASRTYYLYTSNVPGMSGECGVGVMAYTSTDLKHWRKPTVVFRLPQRGWANDGAWAPEVHAWQGKYYLLTTMYNEKLALDQPSASGWKAFRRGTIMAVSDSPRGPFVPLNHGEPVVSSDLMTLDGTLHIDRAGKPWYVYAHEWVQTADGTIEAMSLTSALKSAGAPVLLFKASEADWSNGQKPVDPDGKPAKAPVYVTDGPQLYPSTDGSLLMLWSSYDKNGYVQSVARSASGDVRGPWTQLPPILKRDSGHGMLFDTFDGKRMLVVHRPFKNARGKLYEVRDAGGRIEILNQRVDLDGDHLMGVAERAPQMACPAAK